MYGQMRLEGLHAFFLANLSWQSGKPFWQTTKSTRHINGSVGIRGILSHDNSTEQDTQGQHNQQQHAVHGGSSFCAWSVHNMVGDDDGSSLRASLVP
jgi:hypothetical protein